MRKENRGFELANVIIPIFVGGLIYYLFCKDVLFVKTIDEIVGLKFEIGLKSEALIFRLIRNYLLDMLWAYSLTFLITLILKPCGKKIFICALISVATGTLLELLQLFNLTSGVFDVWDIFTESLSSLFAVLVFNIGGKINEEI